MKRGTKIAVFIGSMALTVGSLVAVIGPRHHRYCGMNGRGACGHENYYRGDCGNQNNCRPDSLRGE
jgi:hypothetical protein